ncbi:dithiol-disulfide isomerase [Bacillus thuringiensis]|uniref:Dithiol-disulfide isomerase n=1 Tax=Bacillus thuringiensis TaxID=1428 RepID=A0A9X7BI48_BACTU|nr:dithiol-disulfide isomerase [Bacillus thuringiensis serovar kim]PDY31431.1 dithiol-disulfide isomerase [Bacillus thuringiensis]PDY33037.1 dithiol-disulfide isomerase [Bacillus thuringiensis]PEB47423.1 dithiol-disulfide isomerase [Bacillus thuringiensis]PED25544.1 dithiol-disulfide isomerase [Bacillus thuringiensis]
MTPINAVIPMMRAATVIKSIKKAIICKLPLCLSVCLLYEIKNKKERNVRKIFNLL